MFSKVIESTKVLFLMWTISTNIYHIKNENWEALNYLHINSFQNNIFSMQKFYFPKQKIINIKSIFALPLSKIFNT